ncbi:MAG: hydrogenase-4 component G [Thermodesulfobacteriota bacterium]
MEIQNAQSFYGQFDFFQTNYLQKNDQVKEIAGDRTLKKTMFEAHLTVFQQEVQVYSEQEFKGQGKSLYNATLRQRMFSLDISITRENSIYSPSVSKNNQFDKGGFWGVEKTADRIAKFVTKGGGNNLNRLRQGREGVIRGFKEAEKLWGGKLPEISYETIKKALETINEQIRETGGSAFEIRI